MKRIQKLGINPNSIKHTPNLGISPDLNYKTKIKGRSIGREEHWQGGTLAGEEFNHETQGEEHWQGYGRGCAPGKD